MSAPTHLLSSDERLLRRSVSSSSADRSLSPGGVGGGSNGRSRGGSPVNYRPGNLNRRISAGAVGVFGIGVGAAPRREEPRPRGREVTINLFGDKTSPEAEMERHERRLSAALGVDRSAKVFSFARENEQAKEGYARKGGVMGTPGSESVSDTLWEDVLESGSRKLPCRRFVEPYSDKWCQANPRPRPRRLGNATDELSPQPHLGF